MAYTKTIFPSFNKDEVTGQIIKEKVNTTIKVHPLQPIIFMESMCDEFIGVKLQDKLGNYLIKTNNKSEIDTTHFYLANNEQKIFVDPSYMGELMAIEYYSIGGYKFSDKLVATQYDESNTVTETLNDIITQGRASIDFYNASGSAIQLQDDLEATIVQANSKITEGETTVTNIETAIANGDISTVKSDIVSINSSLSEKATHVYPIMTTVEIQTILDNFREVLFVDGIFNVNPLFIKSDTVIYMSPNTIIKANTGFGQDDCMITIKDVSNITIYGNCATIQMLKSEYTTGEWRHGIIIENSNNVIIHNLQSLDSGGDGYYISGNGLVGTYSDNIHLINCISKNNKRQGLSIVSGKNIYIYGGLYSDTVGTNPQFGIDLEPNSATDFLENINLVGVRTSNNNGGGISIVPNELGNTISVNIKDCISVGDKIGMLITNPGSITKLYGDVLINNFRHYDTSESGIVVRGWNEYSPKVIIKDCYGENVGSSSNAISNSGRCGIYFSVEIASWGTWFGNIEIQNYTLNDTRATPLNFLPVYCYDFKTTLLKNIKATDVKGNVWTYEPNGVKISPVLLYPKYEDCIVRYTNEYKIIPMSSRIVESVYYSGTTIRNSDTIKSPIYTLPLASNCIGMEITFDVEVEGGYIAIIPNALNTIKLKSPSNGTGIASTLKGSRIKLKCVSSTEWQVVEEIGSWALAGFTQEKYTTMSSDKAPTTGTWIDGDKLINSKPTLLKNISKWVCVTSGSPGEWIAQGTGTGTTAQRPTLVVGDKCYSYYDTTLSKMILWNGTTWLV